VPLPHILVPLSGLTALAGGLSVLLGFQTRFEARLLVSFLVPVTMMMHNFWAVPDPATSQIEKATFIKNVAMLGGALVISYFGAGPLSLDAFMKPESTDRANHATSVPSTRTRFVAKEDRFLLPQRRSRRA
jgi:putative oxidoreductase